MVFITNDLCCKHIAMTVLDIPVESYIEEKYEYDGYKEVYLTMDEMNDFYSNMDKNTFNLNINEYLLIYNQETNELVDKMCWTGEKHRNISYTNFNSRWFGEVKPMKNDVYQALVADSFLNNKITMVKGPAGTGKTFLSLACLI